LNPIKKLLGTTLKKAPWLGAPFLKEPVFLIGSGRSGTTYLQHILELHPDIDGYPGEAEPLWHVATYPYHEKQPPVPPIWLDPETFTNFSVQNWPSAWKYTIKGMFGSHFLFSHKHIFLQKTVMNNFMLEEMLHMYPKAKFIYLIRNGWSVALSYQKKELQKYANPIYRKYIDKGDLKRVREIHAKYWNDTIERVEEDKKKYFSASNFLEIRYENLVAKPEETIKDILGFMGLPFSENSDFRAAVAGVSDKNYKAESEIDPAEHARLEEVMRPALTLKGYV
jgi:hypothetical protein